MTGIPDSLDGRRMLGQYLLLRRLGGGGMGNVYLARSPAGRVVAIKVIRPELARDDNFRVRFRREVAAARNVSGAFTASVIDADPDAELPWMATVYVPAPSLAQAVAGDPPLPATPLPTRTVLTLAAGLAEALQAIHSARLVHRDLKPSNVLLARDGPLVIDFGVSWAPDGSRLTEAGAVVGTVGFMSPEQATAGEIGPASDVFSLGGVLLFAATGREPFGTGTTAAVLYRVVHEPPDLRGMPATLSALVKRCMAKDPARRPAPADLLRELSPRVGFIAAGWLPAAIAAKLDSYAVTSLPGDGFGPTKNLTGPEDWQVTQPAPRAAPEIPAAEARRGRFGFPRHKRRRLIATAAVVVALALGGLLTWSPWANSDNPPAAYATESLATDSPTITAAAYFGQANSVISALSGVVTFNTAATFLVDNPRRCVLTVVFSHVTGPLGVVYARGLKSGWVGAENTPSPDPQGGNAHQQLIVPPPTAVGDSWGAWDSLSAGSLTVQSSAYHLALRDQRDGTQTWQLDGQPVTCEV